jgi:hypothetical protein
MSADVFSLVRFDRLHLIANTSAVHIDSEYSYFGNTYWAAGKYSSHKRNDIK